MPVSHDLAADLARETARLYEEAEAHLIRLIADKLAKGLEAPEGVEDRLAGIQALRRTAEAIVVRLEREGSYSMRRAVVMAYRRGRAATLAELAETLGLDDDIVQAADDAEFDVVTTAGTVQALAQAVVNDTGPVHGRLLRATEDVYREVVASSAARVTLGTATRRQAAQEVLDRLTARGVTTFTDRAGRRWELASYVEMAVRTAAARAAVQAQLDEMQARGVSVVVVSDAPRDCPLCHRWENKLLALSGPPGIRTVTAEHAINDGEMVVVPVAGTLGEAMAAGLLHPNCRHSFSAWKPGVSSPPEPTAVNSEDAAKPYAAVQHQRYLERQVRASKRREAAALDTEATKKARARLKAYQARLRAHTAAHDLRRKSEREQIHSAR